MILGLLGTLMLAASAQCDALCSHVVAVLQAANTQFQHVRGERLTRTATWRGAISLVPGDYCEIWKDEKRGALWQYQCWMQYDTARDAEVMYQELRAAVREAVSENVQIVEQANAGEMHAFSAVLGGRQTLRVEHVSVPDGASLREYDVTFTVSAR